ncbi:hypothetical protein MRB53_007194 [Persea americana]|uniref:Uncharacterized protein n=1 Tax=Persea americana TaxID=3435 RepID=A0ACC2MI48_PERAE|nr:hypothetical protein MRB53_007194 [Persea americana]
MWKQNKQNGFQEESKVNGKSKQVEFDVVPVESNDDYIDEEETSIDVIPVESEGNDSDEEEIQAQEPPQEQADSIAASRPKKNIRKSQRVTNMVAYALPMVEESVPTTFKEVKRHPENADMPTKRYQGKSKWAAMAFSFFESKVILESNEQKNPNHYLSLERHTSSAKEKNA